MSQPSQSPAITLDDLIALNDEIAALVRAKVPLERGLQDLGRDLPGRLGQFASALARRTGSGEPLVDVLGDPDFRLPKIYRAVVEAGVRSGRLPAALESLAGSMRRLAEARRGVVLALLYPLLLLIVAWGFFAFTTAQIAPKLLVSFEMLRVPGAIVFRPLAWCGRSAAIWGPIGPMVFLAVAGLWWYAATRATVVGSRRACWLLGWLPWLGRTLRWSRTAIFAEILALLVENGLPLDAAVLLAGEAAGDPQLSEAAKELAAAIRRGEPSGGTGPAATGGTGSASAEPGATAGLSSSVAASGGSSLLDKPGITRSVVVAPVRPEERPRDTSGSEGDSPIFASQKSGQSPPSATGSASAEKCATGSASASHALPPLLEWLIGGRRQEALLPALRSVAEDYRRRAQHQADLARLWLPVLLVAGIGGAIVLAYSLALFVPYSMMLKSLAGG